MVGRNFPGPPTIARGGDDEKRTKAGETGLRMWVRTAQGKAAREEVSVS